MAHVGIYTLLLLRLLYYYYYCDYYNYYYYYQNYYYCYLYVAHVGMELMRPSGCPLFETSSRVKPVISVHGLLRWILRKW